ncbi:Heterokaryon incompatibility protein (HET) domain containing protein [Rhypophila sp. PSN 637]
MRLLNTRTEQLHEFFTIPRYAILSHTWGDEEVTYRDLTATDNINYRKLRGYAKIAGSCTVAFREGFEWIWIDTCCIDKSSSAELSEAINSMFNWYKDSAVCYAYLGDVPEEMVTSNTRRFVASRWFTRGWTLQELVAPSSVVFLNASWDELGTKTTLAGLISTVTGIDQDVLSPLPVITNTGWGSQLHASDISSTLRQCSIAQRMSWAAKRTTTRLEDQAYSLMGLFGINMPLLYGEGAKAFLRLQKEIMHQSDDDMSIFVWRYPVHSRPNWSWSGLLAPSPECFESYSDVRHFEFSDSGNSTTRLGGFPPSAGQLVNQHHAARALDVSNTHVQLTVSTLRLRKRTEMIRAWSRSASGLLLRSRSSLLSRENTHDRDNQNTNQSTASSVPGFLDLDRFYGSTTDPLESSSGGLILVVLLDCWTPAGQVGLVLVDKQPAPLVRHHSRTVFAPLLLRKSVRSSGASIIFSPLQDIRCKLFSDDSLFASSPDRMLVREPKARFLLRIVESGYTYCVAERASGGQYRLGSKSANMTAEFPCLDASQPLVMILQNAKSPAEWPPFAMCGVFEFRQMRAQVTLLHLQHDEGNVELENETVQGWLASCRQNLNNGALQGNMSQTRMSLKDTKSDVVVKVRPSLSGIDVVVHLQECGLRLGLQNRLTGLTIKEDG